MTGGMRFSVDLYWLPLGAGGHSVRLNGRVFEAVAARLARRTPCDLYHSALVVRVPDGRFVIEQAPIRDSNGGERGVVAEGAVGSRWAGRFGIFRYEVRCWHDGVIPDIGEAVESPQQLTNDPLLAQHLLDLVPAVSRRSPPTPADTRNANVERLCSRRKSPRVPAQPGTAMTGLSRRRSRVRVPSLPYGNPCKLAYCVVVLGTGISRRPHKTSVGRAQERQENGPRANLGDGLKPNRALSRTQSEGGSGRTAGGHGRDQKFAEPVALSSTLPADRPLPRRALRRSFDLNRAPCSAQRGT